MQEKEEDLAHHSSGRVDEVDRHVGKRLRMRRIMLGLSQQVLGEEVGVSIQQIQKYEKATNRVASGKLYQFSQLLRVPVSYFFDEVEDSVKKIKNSFTSKLAESQSEFSTEDKDSANEREVLALVRSYNEITDSTVRKKILDLVKTLSA